MTDEGYVRCPVCGRIFGEESGMKVHHANVHDGPLEPPVEFTCETCGDRCERRPGKVTGDGPRFCSRECQFDGDGSPYKDAEWLREQYHGEGKTMDEIADDVDRGQTTILRWMNIHGIEARGAHRRTSAD